MTPALYILSFVDDFGNQIIPCDMEYDCYVQRYNWFKEGGANMGYQTDEYEVTVEVVDKGYYKSVVGYVGGREYISFSNQVSNKWGVSGSTCLSTQDYKLAAATIECYTKCLEMVEHIKATTCSHCGK